VGSKKHYLQRELSTPLMPVTVSHFSQYDHYSLFQSCATLPNFVVVKVRHESNPGATFVKQIADR
jgi:hypothetical protein